MKKMQIFNRIVSILAPNGQYNTEYCIEPTDIGLTVVYGTIEHQKFVPLSSSDMNKMKFSIDDLHMAAVRNSMKMRYSMSKYPKNDRIQSIDSKFATSIILNRGEEILGDSKIIVFAPVYDDFIIYIKDPSVNEIIEFYRIAFAMITEAKKKSSLLSDKLYSLTSDNYSKFKIEILNMEEKYGIECNLFAVNNLEDIPSQIEVFAVNYTAKILSKMYGNEEALLHTLNRSPEFLSIHDKLKNEITLELLQRKMHEKD